MTYKDKVTRGTLGNQEGNTTGIKAEKYYPLDSIGYVINLAARLSQLNLARHLEGIPVSPAQLPLIYWLLEEEGLTQTELCERTHIEQPSVAVSLANMERRKLVVRKRDKKDRRKYRIYLSEILKDAANKMHQEAVASNREILSAISPRASAQLMKVLRKIIENLLRIT